MGKTSGKARDEWNSVNYTQIKVSVKPETAAKFKAACAADNVSMASELSGFMERRGGAPPVSAPPKGDPMHRRGGRKKLLDALMKELEQIKDAEGRYRDAIPQNLSGSVRYENAEQAIQAMEDALEALGAAY